MIITKLKSPLLVYILVWATGGVYWIFWLLAMMSEINRLSGSRIYNKPKIILTGLFWFVCIAAIFSGAWFAYQNQSLMVMNLLFFLVLMMTLLWFIAVAFLHADMGRQIGGLQARGKIKPQATFGRSLFYFFLFYTVIPYLQSNYNELTEVRSSIAQGAGKTD